MCFFSIFNFTGFDPFLGADYCQTLFQPSTNSFLQQVIKYYAIHRDKANELPSQSANVTEQHIFSRKYSWRLRDV